MSSETPRASDPSTPLAEAELAAIRRSRRHPRPTQFDYLHLRYLVDGLRQALAGVPPPVDDVLDVWCGSRPYDDLFPRSARLVGLDVEGNPYGAADVVSDTLLPFPDTSFDLVVCIESFQFVAEPARAIDEFLRVLRPGGTALLTVPFMSGYDPSLPEARYTEPQLRALFAAWRDVEVRENGGRTVAWTTLTGSLLSGLEQRLGRSALRAFRSVFTSAYVALNGIGVALASIEDRLSHGNARLPMDLLVTARRPGGA
jgi:SAM-dependent methyltransferase